MLREQGGDLIALRLGFNLFPAEYAHASWLAPLGIGATESSRMVHSPLWLRAVSTTLLRQRQLDRHFDVDFHDPAKRLALLDAATLRRIAGLVLATLLRERLRRIVKRSEVQALHDCMGVEAHQFALRWGGAVPPIPQRYDDSDRHMSAESWAARSVAQLFAVVPSHALGVVERMRLRFPAQWQLPDSQQPRLDDAQRAGLMSLIVAVIAESAAQWSWLFAGEAAPIARPARGDA